MKTIAIPNGIVHEPLQEYSSKTDFISSIELRKFKISPRHYKHYISDKDEQAREQRNTLISEAITLRITHPDVFDANYACLKDSMLPAANKLGQKTYQMKENREFRDVTFPAMNVGKTILTEWESDLIERIYESSIGNELIEKLFESGMHGISMYEKDEKTGLIIKDRANWIPNRGSVLIDFKICKNSTPRLFERDIFNNGYANQAEWQWSLFDKKEFIFFACEEQYPCNIEAFILDQHVLDKSYDENRVLLDLIWFCKKVAYYPSYSEFEKIKQMYYDLNLRNKDKDAVYNELCQFFEMKKQPNLVYLPNWI